jgi:hypothetical protein
MTINPRPILPIDENVRLAPLHFLEGNWQGEGRGPYGPYKLEAHVERRGRWLLMISTIFDAKSKEITYVSTQVYGYDRKGLCLSFFDTAGSFDFRGKETADGLRYDWKEGKNWKRSEYWPEAVGTIDFI